MARPLKEGLDYFPLDCHYNDAMKLIKAEFGLIGVGIVVTLWQKIYGEKGYFTPWDSDVALVFSSENGVGANVVHEVISACMRRGIFDREKFEQHGVLTSDGIQKRYMEATARRGSKKIDGRYLLIAIPSKKVNVDNNGVSDSNNAENADNNSQSKVNEITTTTYGMVGTDEQCGNVENPVEKPVENFADIPTFAEIHGYFRDYTVIPSHELTTQTGLFIAKNAHWGWKCLPNWRAAADLWAERCRDGFRGE